jgi:hypothetical protein
MPLTPFSTLLVQRTPFPKTISYIFIKHNRLTKIQNHTNIIINYGNKILVSMINYVSYEVLRHIRPVLRYWRDQKVVSSPE